MNKCIGVIIIAKVGLVDDLIEDLLETECYLIDFLPKIMMSSFYFEIEEFFYENYIKDFSRKIVRIVAKILGYYPAQIYFIKSGEFAGEDIRNKPLKELDKIISRVIIEDRDYVKIILGDAEKFLISIEGGFSINIYNISGEELKLLKILIEQENLFLRKAESEA